MANSVLDMLIRGMPNGGPGLDPRFQTPGINPNAPDIRQQGIQGNPGIGSKINKGFGKLDSFLGSDGGSFLMNLLAQSGYSTVPGSPLGAIGRAGLATQQQKQASSANDLKRQLLESQIGLNKARATGGGQAQRIVQSAQTLSNGNVGYLNAFTGEVVDTGVKAGGKSQIIDMPGIGQVKYDPTTGSLTQVNPEDVIRSAEADRKGAVVAAEEGARTDAIPVRERTKAQIAAEIDLPTKKIAFDKAREEVARLKSHPGKSSSIGFKGIESGFGILPRPFPGTPAADFVAIRDQAAGGAFLEAYQQLKGGGPITDREGQAALAAMTRMADPGISEKEFDRALDDYLEALDAGFRKLEKAAQGDFSIEEKKSSEGKPISEMTDEELEAILNGS